jgi:hypothetical protein
MFVPVKSIEQQGDPSLAFGSIPAGEATDDAGERHARPGDGIRPDRPNGYRQARGAFGLVDADKAFPEKACQVFTGLFDQCRALAESIRAIEMEIFAHARHDDTARRSYPLQGSRDRLDAGVP